LFSHTKTSTVAEHSSSVYPHERLAYMVLSFRVAFYTHAQCTSHCPSHIHAYGEITRTESCFFENINQIKSIKFICDTKIQTPMKEVKQKVMRQQDTKAAKCCTNRCPNPVNRMDFGNANWEFPALCLRSARVTSVLTNHDLEI